MKKYFVTLAFGFISLLLNAQDFTGSWAGQLEVQGFSLKIVFHINENENGYKATMDSPDQYAYGLEVTEIQVDSDSIKLKLSSLYIEFSGQLIDENIEGSFRQSGFEFPLKLARQEREPEKLNRPQEPLPPYPYYTEEVKFDNIEDNVTLAGTLSLPTKDGVFPTVILITGSGPQDRNQEILGHKPFLVISDYLTRRGMGVLRYDDRGTAKSTGDFSSGTSLDFSRDVLAAVDYLKSRPEVNANKIGLIGHSEGGLIAWMVGSENPDIAFIVSLASPGIRGDSILLLQQKLIYQQSGISKEIVKDITTANSQIYGILSQAKDTSEVLIELSAPMTKLYEALISEKQRETISREAFISEQIATLNSPWMKFFLSYDPAEAIKKVTCPVLALNGSNDLQVPPKENLNAIKSLLSRAGNGHLTLVEIPGLNHLFQESSTGLPNEYGMIEQTFAPTVLEIISDWISAQVEEDEQNKK